MIIFFIFVLLNEVIQEMEKLSTEEVIKKAAHELFAEKGYSATRTRDIAERANINLALLNYYFRSKENLFKIVMNEKIAELFGAIIPILQLDELEIDQKIDKVISTYIKMLSENSDLPFFVINEMRKNKKSEFQGYIQKMFQEVDIFHFIKTELKINQPYHFLVNFIGMIVFPFIAKPILVDTGLIEKKYYKEIIRDQKIEIHKLIERFQNQSKKDK